MKIRVSLLSIMLVTLAIITGGCGEVVQPVKNSPAARLQMSWTIPTVNTDGSTIKGELAGYRVYYGSQPGSYFNVINISDPFTTSVNIDNLEEGQYYLVVTAFNTFGNESGYSNEVVKLATPYGQET